VAHAMSMAAVEGSGTAVTRGLGLFGAMGSAQAENFTESMK
jgi:hypothetical protein